MGKVDPDDKLKLEQAQWRQALAEAKMQENSEVLSVLEQLRRTRKARGGVGAPLQIPLHLRGAAAGVGIVITDADLDPTAPPKNLEEEDDTNSDTARAINEGLKE